MILAAPDSFKGSLSAARAARALAEGVRRVLPEEEVLEVPLADGGEGTVDALLASLGGKKVPARVQGPLGEPVEAFFGLMEDGRTAVVEMAAASGLPLVPPGKRDVLRASTFGTGELIRLALEAGAREIVVGLGGSATCDGGAGMARALGFSLLDKKGREIPPGGGALAFLEKIDSSRRHPALEGTRILGACDVANPLLGEKGAARVFAPQKGASPKEVELLEEGLRRLARVLRDQLGRDVADLPGAGAAGGLGAGLAGFLGASLEPGFELVARSVGLEEKVRAARLALTGEGRLDAQTSMGKAPQGVIRLAQKAGVPVFAFAGELAPGHEALFEQGLTSAFSLCPGPASLEESREKAQAWLAAAAERALRAWKAGLESG